jgi:Mn2+/Fe2+ NRAMP family transporter
LVVAMVGTTVAPWQLFFQQSSVVDKRITARWLPYERADLLVGMLLFTIGAVAVLATFAVAFGANPAHGEFVDAGRAAQGLRDRVGTWAGALFAVALVNGSILGAGAVTLATSYALGDVFGVKHSLHRKWRDAPVFHGSFVLCLACAAAVVLIPDAPLGVVTVGVQVLAGVLLPSATVFLLLLANDRAVLGPWTNPRWLNVLAVVVVGALIELSAVLTLTTLFPDMNVALAAAVPAGVLVAAVVGWAISGSRREQSPPLQWTPWERATWTMPQIETLPPPAPSRSRAVGLVALRAYLVIAAAVVAVRLLQSITAG